MLVPCIELGELVERDFEFREVYCSICSLDCKDKKDNTEV